MVLHPERFPEVANEDYIGRDTLRSVGNASSAFESPVHLLFRLTFQRIVQPGP